MRPEDEDWLEFYQDEEPTGSMRVEPGLVTPLPFSCPWCGEPNETNFDPGGGSTQQFVEDCAVCCHPIVISIRYDASDSSATIAVEPE